jgi:hypothetical protein
MGTIEMDQVVLVEAIGDEGEGFDANLLNIMESSYEGEGFDKDPVESSEGEGFVVYLIHEHSVKSQLHVITSGKVDKIAIFP